VGHAAGRDRRAVHLLSHEPPLRRALRFRAEDAYGLLLADIVLTFLVFAQIDPARWSRLVLAPEVGAMLLLSLYASHARPRLMRGAVIGVGIAFVLVLFEAIFNTDLFDGSTYAIYGLLVLIAPVVIVNRILRHAEVTVSTILGAVCAYLLIGLLFGFIYGMISRIDSRPFFSGHPVVDQFDYFYFSYASLTTVGFGDFVSRGDFGRSLSVLEAALGQIFLVTLVARLVSLFGQRRDGGS
jgi:voltage-gated potassium channel